MSAGLLTLFGGGWLLYSVHDSLRFMIDDAYHAVFKVLITDRVLSEQSVVHSNLPYCNTDNPRQTLDLYVPQVASKRPMPLLIFIHGGGWRAGDKSSELLSRYGQNILKSGIAIASLNYRLYPEATYPQPNQDIACALDYLAANAKQYDISKHAWALFGDSAGAQLGAYAMSDPSVNAPVRLFIGFYGPYDMVMQSNRKPLRDIDAWRYTNKGRDAALASPIARPVKKDAVYLLYHGDKDRIVHTVQSQNFADHLRSANAVVNYQVVKHADHYFSPRTQPSGESIRKSIISALETYLRE